MFHAPDVELSETEREFHLRVALPGFDAKNVKVAALADRLIVEAESSHRHEGEDATIHFCEFTEYHVFRQIPMPQPVDVDLVSATLDNGVLHVQAAKAKQASGKTAAA